MSHLVQVAQHADDLDRAALFYERLLGRPPAARFDPPGLVFFILGDTRLLLERGAPSALIYLEVRDVADRVAQLRSAGVRIHTEPHVIFRHDDDTLGPAGTEESMAFIEDSEGNVVALVSRAVRTGSGADRAVAGHQRPGRPIGWWLKEADARLDAAFDEALQGRGVDRRGWQVLTSLARAPLASSDLVESLSSFDSPAAVEAVVAGLEAAGQVARSGGLLRLTEDGRRRQELLEPLVAAGRGRVAAALPQDDYVALVRLLERLTDALGPGA